MNMAGEIDIGPKCFKQSWNVLFVLAIANAFRYTTKERNFFFFFCTAIVNLRSARTAAAAAAGVVASKA